MTARVLITRSEPGASETAQRLAALGYRPIVEPLFDIEPIPATLPDFDVLAFTSANGVRAFAKLSHRRDAPVFCVGGRTADAARDAGFSQVAAADGDVGALAGLIAEKLAPGARVLHSGNEESRGDLSGQLRALGHDARFVATFRAAPVSSPGPVLAAHLAGRRSFEAILIHSPRAGSILADFAKVSPSREKLNVAAISPPAALPLNSLADRIEIANGPNERELLNALTRLNDFG